MEPITQKDQFGCGIACIAFVVGKTYDEVIKVLGRDKAETAGFYCRELCRILEKFGCHCEHYYLKPKWRKEIYQNGVIVFIKRSKRYPVGHYLVRYKSFWMDPWINFLKDKDVENAQAGFRRRLPGKPIYGIYLKSPK